MMMNSILKTIRESNEIAITFHTSPDGDSLGSSLALMQGLRKLNKNAYILCKEELPKSFSFLPYSKDIDKDKFTLKENTDCVIVLDCGNVERINANLKFENKNCVIINVDHHLSNDLYGNLNFVDANAAAVGEIVYQMLMSLGVEIDTDIATCLYTSLITDTGSFRYSNTSCVTHAIAGDLINCGIDFSSIHRKIFENKDYIRVKLYGKVIEDLKIVDDKICIIRITKNMLKQLNVEEASDTSDVISLGMQINTVEVAILLKESEEGVKVSLRSKSKVDVRKVAENFGGGGHIRASGLCINDKSIYEVEKLILEEVRKEL
ncbi:bifunctional oligoribonuclease and PAP phosphatase NrnA [Clostridium acetireducens DSM 10703]|jgi:phosphoesterase RecJ-like protein|uniref:Bifunctional oligoribonuclease and PAP phosphatase NrnA n=1 Tax=Clostridium acetireducens DSM 10703 TaxID=1121290 RepID=A0A1E8F2G2_9CLOT|nr:bifunctional oligoribonuclease/PAP phosphatase NrnA [Clostridium acetireducens]OFI07731.1 bifunctional oligoribonuclease and PAP phosphatase NrnA [Clostridium acetireducens DSM 10703]